jgi:hypothetical protein
VRQLQLLLLLHCSTCIDFSSVSSSSGVLLLTKLKRFRESPGRTYHRVISSLTAFKN